MQFLFNCAPFKWKGPLKITSCALNFIVLLLTAWGYLLKYLQENKLNSDADMEKMVGLGFGEMVGRIFGKGVGKAFTKMDITQKLYFDFRFWISERLGVRGYFIENVLCKVTSYTFGDYTIEVLGGITKLASTLNREDWQGERNGFVVLSRDRPNQTLLSVHMYSSSLL
nr:ADM_HP1_G0044230.mRNA.1.CDS.1 [Saccharomyces cerevisiae]